MFCKVFNQKGGLPRVINPIQEKGDPPFAQLSFLLF